jgi:hypothetical protein
MEHKDSCPVHKSLPPVLILSRMNLAHTLPPYLLTVYLNIILPSTPRSSEWSLSFSLSNQNFVRICHLPIRSTHPVHLILCWFDHLIILGKEYILWGSLLCNFLQPFVTLSLVGANILLSTVFSNTLRLCSFINVCERDLVHTHTKQTLEVQNLLFYLFF